MNIVFVLAGIFLVVGFTLSIIDHNSIARLNDNGEYELQVGFGAYLGILLHAFLVLVMAHKCARCNLSPNRNAAIIYSSCHPTFTKYDLSDYGITQS